MEILNDNCPGIDFENETHLIYDEILTSLDLVVLVGELNDTYDIEITIDDIVPENFNSAEAMFALIQRLQGK